MLRHVFGGDILVGDARVVLDYVGHIETSEKGPVGPAPGRHSGRENNVQCRSATAQARDLNDQLHRVRHDQGFDGWNS